MYRYLCNISNVKAQCDTPLTGGGLKDDESYETARNIAIEAAESDVDNRCGDTVLLSPGKYCTYCTVLYCTVVVSVHCPDVDLWYSAVFV